MKNYNDKHRKRNIVVGSVVILLISVSVLILVRPFKKSVFVWYVLVALVAIIFSSKFLFKNLREYCLGLFKLSGRKRGIYITALYVILASVLWLCWTLELGWVFSLILIFWLFVGFMQFLNTFKPTPPAEIPYKLTLTLSFVFAWILGLIILFAGVYLERGIYINDNTNTLVDNFRTCVYFSVVTFTTLGYGDFCPTPATREFAALEAIIGFISLGVILSILVHFLHMLTLTKPADPKL